MVIWILIGAWVLGALLLVIGAIAIVLGLVGWAIRMLTY